MGQEARHTFIFWSFNNFITSIMVSTPDLSINGTQDMSITSASGLFCAVFSSEDILKNINQFFLLKMKFLFKSKIPIIEIISQI